MAKKTLYKIFAFGVSVITITAVLILSVFYSYSDNQLKEQLRVVESVVENQLAQDDDTAFISNHIDKNEELLLLQRTERLLRTAKKVQISLAITLTGRKYSRQSKTAKQQ